MSSRTISSLLVDYYDAVEKGKNGEASKLGGEIYTEVNSYKSVDDLDSVNTEGMPHEVVVLHRYLRGFFQLKEDERFKAMKKLEVDLTSEDPALIKEAIADFMSPPPPPQSAKKKLPGLGR